MVMEGGRTVGCFGFDGLSIGCDQLAGHHAKTSETLGEDVGLDVTVVVFACPDESA